MCGYINICMESSINNPGIKLDIYAQERFQPILSSFMFHQNYTRVGRSPKLVLLSFFSQHYQLNRHHQQEISLSNVDCIRTRSPLYSSSKNRTILGLCKILILVFLKVRLPISILISLLHSTYGSCLPFSSPTLSTRFVPSTI